MAGGFEPPMVCEPLRCGGLNILLRRRLETGTERAISHLEKPFTAGYSAPVVQVRRCVWLLVALANPSKTHLDDHAFFLQHLWVFVTCVGCNARGNILPFFTIKIKSKPDKFGFGYKLQTGFFANYIPNTFK